MLLSAYRGLSTLSAPVLRGLLARRAREGKEDPERVRERQGIADRPRPAGPVIWAHGASVGESLSILPLVERLLKDVSGSSVLITTGTVTSAEILRARMPKRAFHQYVPVDHPAWVSRFLDHWQPDLALWIESDLWPNLVSMTQARGIPMVLLNGRLSERSFRNWRWGRSMVRNLLSGFVLRLAQTEGDRERFAALGAGDVYCFGNLKFAAPPLPVDQNALRALKRDIGDRPVWLAASTHEGEEEQIAEAHLYAKTHETELPQLPDLLTLLVPRHASRGPAVARLMSGRGLKVALRSRGDPVAADTDIYVADTMGELGLFYRLTDVVFIGGSLIAHGGHNPIEPGLLDCTVLHGPHMHNFSEVVAALKEEGGSIEVRNYAELIVAVADLLTDDSARLTRVEAARRVATAETDVLEHVMGALRPHVPRGARKAHDARA